MTGVPPAKSTSVKAVPRPGTVKAVPRPGNRPEVGKPDLCMVGAPNLVFGIISGSKADFHTTSRMECGGPVLPLRSGQLGAQHRAGCRAQRTGSGGLSPRVPCAFQLRRAAGWSVSPTSRSP